MYLFYISLALILNHVISNTDKVPSFPSPHATYILHSIPSTISSSKRSHRHLTNTDPSINPLFPGYGTHFTYVYVGTPPQRQSVIIDTASSYTGFPCAGCLKCGEHTDPPYNYIMSSSAQLPKCSNDLCHIAMTYTEGSSWQGFAVVDTFFVGSIDPPTSSPPYAFPNYFACQTSVTGLFEAQLADGILGLAMAVTSLPYQMQTKGITKTKLFALCFRNGGGIFTIAGVNPELHTSKTIHYTSLVPNTNGWYMIKIVGITLMPQSGESSPLALRIPKNTFSPDKSAIIDSGTTDTYLPEALLPQFASKFRSITGIDYTNEDMTLTADQLLTIPEVNFVFNSTTGESFVVKIPALSYIEDVGEGKYAFRLYFIEKDGGAILGANFMNGYNIIFDADNMRVGFAVSTCDYEQFAPGTPPPPGPSGPPAATSCLTYTECSADCNKSNAAGGYTAVGQQTLKNTCDNTKATQDCHVSCDAGNHIVRGNPSCPDTAWSECSSACTQERYVSSAGCKMAKESRSCTAGACVVTEGDFIVLLDLKVSIPPKKWSYVHSEIFIQALEEIFFVPAGSIDLLNDASGELTHEVRLHFEVHLKAKDYSNVMDFRRAAEMIPITADKTTFPRDLLRTVNNLSALNDQLDYNRYGYLQVSDVTVLKAVALPIGFSRDLDHQHVAALSDSETLLLILIGVAVGVSLLLCIVCFCYCRLRAQHEALSKDKVGGGSLRRMWERFQNLRLKRKDRASAPVSSSARVPLMRSSRIEDDDQLDEEDIHQLRV